MNKEIEFKINTLLANSGLSLSQQIVLRHSLAAMSEAMKLQTIVALENDPKLIAPAVEMLQKIGTDASIDSVEETITETLKGLAA